MESAIMRNAAVAAFLDRDADRFALYPVAERTQGSFNSPVRDLRNQIHIFSLLIGFAVFRHANRPRIRRRPTWHELLPKVVFE